MRQWAWAAVPSPMEALERLGRARLSILGVYGSPRMQPRRGKALGLGSLLWGVTGGEVEWVVLARHSLTWTHAWAPAQPFIHNNPGRWGN